jgi:hypothetical protein
MTSHVGRIQACDLASSHSEDNSELFPVSAVPISTAFLPSSNFSNNCTSTASLEHCRRMRPSSRKQRVRIGGHIALVNVNEEVYIDLEKGPNWVINRINNNVINYNFLYIFKKKKGLKG